MSVKFSNNGHSTLAASLASNATSITVASGHGARFPSLSGSEFFYATLIDTSNNLEIVKVTAKPTQKPLAIPPLTNPNKIIQLGVVETRSSSKLLLYLVIKKDDTVLA